MSENKNLNEKKLEKKNEGDNSSSLKNKNKKYISGSFEKEKKLEIKKKNFLETFQGRYQKFIKLVNPLVGIRGKLMNIRDLHYCIEEIYSIRFINDINKETEDQIFPFPNFVLEFFSNKYIKKPLVAQHSLDLILSIDFFKSQDIIINIFSLFLNEQLETDDLEFYLYVRFCIEKELNTTFIDLIRQKNKKGIKLSQEENFKYYLNVKSCINIASNIFGKEEKKKMDNFLNFIEEILIEQNNKGMKKNLIAPEQILKFTLENYHQNKLNKIKNDKNDNKRYTYEYIPNNYYGKKNKLNNPERISRLKIIIVTYIKQKELDVFFGKLLSLYMVYEKNDINDVEEILKGIKDLVSKKINILINILFNKDEKGWFNSLKLKETDKEGKEYYDKLTNMIDKMMNYENLIDIPENMIRNFGETLLYTPELNSQINKLVLKRFE